MNKMKNNFEKTKKIKKFEECGNMFSFFFFDRQNI